MPREYDYPILIGVRVNPFSFEQFRDLILCQLLILLFGHVKFCFLVRSLLPSRPLVIAGRYTCFCRKK
jgi:hypothetical protein